MVFDRSHDLSKLEVLGAIQKLDSGQELNKWGLCVAQDRAASLIFIGGGLTDSSVCFNFFLFKHDASGYFAQQGQEGVLPTCHSVFCSATFANQQLYLFGGQTDWRKSGECQYSNELFRLDPTSGKWTQLKTEAKSRPCPRSQAFTFLFDNDLFVFGGCDGRQVFRDLHKLDLATLTWTRVETSGPCRPLGLVGLCPPHPDSRVSNLRPLAVKEGHKMYLASENFESNTYDLLELDLTKYEWKKLNENRCKKLKMRAGSCLTLSNGNLVLTGSHSTWAFPLTQKRFSWSRERLLWAACFKNDPDSCLLAKCPPIIIYKILTYLNNGCKRFD